MSHGTGKRSTSPLFPSSHLALSYAPRPALLHHCIKTFKAHNLVLPFYPAHMLSQPSGWFSPFSEDLESWFSLLFYSPVQVSSCWLQCWCRHFIQYQGVCSLCSSTCMYQPYTFKKISSILSDFLDFEFLNSNISLFCYSWTTPI